MNKPFEFNEAANSPDFTDEEVQSAIPTSTADDIAPHLTDQTCTGCGKPLHVTGHEKRFRFPHFYWRSRLKCPEGHHDQRVFQVTWLYEVQHVPR